MGKIYCVMGKSASGKDSIYRELMVRRQPELDRIVPYTTRPVRKGEALGKDYIFCDEKRVEELTEEGRIIELRAYNTVYGIWKYFTVDDGQIDLGRRSYLYIVTLAGYRNMQKYFGKDRVVPIYIEVEDGERLMRALARERQQKQPGYAEMCRRFLADTEDFSGARLAEAGIEQVFVNDELEDTVRQVTEFIAESERCTGG